MVFLMEKLWNSWMKLPRRSFSYVNVIFSVCRSQWELNFQLVEDTSFNLHLSNILGSNYSSTSRYLLLPPADISLVKRYVFIPME